MNTIRLNDGNDIPSVGFGVFMIPSDGPTYDAVLQALQAGYRHIDTAAAYFNESDVGRAVRDSGIPRLETAESRDRRSLSRASCGCRTMAMRPQRRASKHR